MVEKWILASPGKWGKLAPKVHFLDIFFPISGRRPEMDLYQVHGIATQFIDLGRT